MTERCYAAFSSPLNQREARDFLATLAFEFGGSATIFHKSQETIRTNLREVNITITENYNELLGNIDAEGYSVGYSMLANEKWQFAGIGFEFTEDEKKKTLISRLLEFAGRR